MDRNELISGQIVLRESTEKRDDTNRKLMMVVGVIAVPESFQLKGEHKYTIGGTAKPRGIEGLFNLVDPDFKMPKAFEELNITLYPESEEDISDETTGQGLGGIITSHRRWRI